LEAALSLGAPIGAHELKWLAALVGRLYPAWLDSGFDSPRQRLARALI